MILGYKDKDLIFSEIKLFFNNKTYSDVFANKNNRTLLETIKNKKYKNLETIVSKKYSEFFQWPLGKFILLLKSSGDKFYLKFLNKYGNATYCQFKIQDDFYLNKKGLYIYYINSELKYIGRCLDSFKKRINQGYGKIYPKNCFIDGQSTNCHLNYLIAKNKDNIKFAALELDNSNEIKFLEKELISIYRPEWNLKL